MAAIKAIVLVALEEEDETDSDEEDEIECTFALFCHLEALRRRKRLLSRGILKRCLVDRRWSSAAFILKTADDLCLTKYCRLNKLSFQTLLCRFRVVWKSTYIGEKKAIKNRSRPVVCRRSLRPAMALLLCLRMLAANPSITELSLTFAIPPTTVSRLSRFALFCLHVALKREPLASVSPLTAVELRELESIVCAIDDTLSGSIGAIDGSLHEVERKAEAGFFDETNEDYNGWKSIYCRKGMQ